MDEHVRRRMAGLAASSRRLDQRGTRGNGLRWQAHGDGQGPRPRNLVQHPRRLMEGVDTFKRLNHESAEAGEHRVNRTPTSFSPQAPLRMLTEEEALELGGEANRPLS